MVAPQYSSLLGCLPSEMNSHLCSACAYCTMKKRAQEKLLFFLIQTVYRPAWNKIVLFLSAFMAEQNPQAALLTYWTYSDNTSWIFWKYLIIIHSIALNLRQDSDTQISNVIIKWICISEMVWHHQDMMGDAVTFQCVVSSWILASSSRMRQENSEDSHLSFQDSSQYCLTWKNIGVHTSWSWNPPTSILQWNRAVNEHKHQDAQDN